MSCLSIVIPVYNSAATLPELVRRVVAAGKLVGTFEIILVDDGSVDRTLDVAQEQARANPGVVTVLSLYRNFGQISAIMAGLRESRGDLVVILDDDLQNPPEEISKLLSALDEDTDFVYGTPNAAAPQTWLRQLYSKLNWKLFELMLSMPPDLKPSSFFIVRRTIVEQILQYAGPYPFIAGLILRITHRGKTVPVRYDQRVVGKSSYNLSRLLRLWLNGFTNFSILPLRIAMATGLLVSLSGFFLLFGMLIYRLLVGPFQSGWLSLLAAVILFAGVQLLALGMVGEYLGRAFMLLNRTPQYAVRKKISY